jgi:hypothetical protein
MIAAPIARRGIFSSLLFVAAVRNPVVFLKKMELEGKYMNATFNEQIAPEVVQAIQLVAAPLRTSSAGAFSAVKSVATVLEFQ